MRKNLFIIQIILVVISFLYTAVSFDEKLLHRNTEVFLDEDTSNYYRITLSINDADLLSNNEISKFIDNIGIKNNLLVSKLYVNFSGDEGMPDSILYYSSNSDYLKNRIFVKNDSFKVGGRYSTFPSDDEDKLLIFFSDIHTSVMPLEFDYKPGGIYILFNSSGDYEQNVKNFHKDIQNSYPKLLSIIDNPGFINKDTDDLNYLFNAKKEKLSISIIAVLLIISIVFTLRKKISILKMEGYSNINIYYQIFAKEYLIFGLLSSFSILVFSSVFFHSNKIVFSFIFKMWIIQYLLLFGLSLILSFIILFIIDSIPITESINGRTNLKEIQYIAVFTKVIICVLLIPTINMGLNSISETIKLNNRYKDIISASQNYYYFGAEKASNYFGDIGSDNALKLYNKITKEYDIYFIANGFVPLDDHFDNMIQVSFVDDLFIEKFLNIKDFDSDKINIIFFEADIIDKDMYISSIVNYFNVERSDINVSHYDTYIKAIDFNSLRYSDYLKNKTLVFIPEELGLEGQLSSKIIYYTEGLSNIQSEIDNIFIEHGYFPSFEIISRKSANASSYQSIIAYLSSQYRTFIILSISYFIINIFTIQVHQANNTNLYFITKCEGISWMYIKNYLYYLVLPTIFSVLLSINNCTSEVILFFIIFESFFYFINIYIMNNKFWRK